MFLAPHCSACWRFLDCWVHQLVKHLVHCFRLVGHARIKPPFQKGKQWSDFFLATLRIVFLFGVRRLDGAFLSAMQISKR